MGALLNILSMFGPLSGAKFWVAIIMAILQFANIYSGVDLGLDEATVAAVIGGIGAVLVWLVPNKNKYDNLPTMTYEDVQAHNDRLIGRSSTNIFNR